MFTLPDNPFTADTGYHFDAWEDPDGNSYADHATIPANTFADGDRIYLTAQWETDGYDVYFDANGGSGSM